jgi:hypothetical protein
MLPGYGVPQVILPLLFRVIVPGSKTVPATIWLK